MTDAEIDAVTLQQWGQQLGVMVEAHRAYARAVLAAAKTKTLCKKCADPLVYGVAMQSTLDCSDEGTCSPAVPGKMISCMKCPQCGWSTA